MTRIFARLFLDEDVDILVGRLVNLHGFDALHVVDAGRTGRQDEEQLAFAVEQGRVLVTHNRDDFIAIDERWRAAGRRHLGIVIAVRRPPREVSSKLVAVLNRLTSDEIEGLVLRI